MDGLFHVPEEEILEINKLFSYLAYNSLYRKIAARKNSRVKTKRVRKSVFFPP